MNFYNGILNHDDIHGSGQIGPRGLPGLKGNKGDKGDKGDGYHLTSDGNYDIQLKNLVNVKNGVNDSDAVTKSQLDTQTSLLQGARPGFVVNDKAAIYSGTGALHAQSLYLKDTPDDSGNSDEIRIITEHQSYENIHLNIPNLQNFDGFGGRRKSELMVTSVDQTIDGKKVFRDIEVPTPNVNNNPSTKKYVDDLSNTKLDKIITKDVNLNNKQLLNLGFSINNPGDVINLGFADQKYLQKVSDSNLNMNEHRIKNSLDPIDEKDLSAKYYVDTEITKVQHNLDLSPFLRKDGQRSMTGDLNMDSNSIIRLKDPVNNTDAVTKKYADGQFIKKTGDTMAGILNMDGRKITNVGSPKTFENDAAINVGFFNVELNASNSNLFTQITNAYKQYVDHSHVSPSGQQRDAFRYLMEDADHSSSENNIVVTGIVHFAASPHEINKKAYEFTLVKDTDGSNDYRSRIGFNLYSLPLGYYTIIVEYFPPEMTNVIVTAQGTSINISTQTTKKFRNYTKTLVKFHNWIKSSPNYIFFNLHGKTTSSTTGHMIIYGVKGYVSSIEPDVYDIIFVVNNGNMGMHTNIDMNNHKIINLANPTDDGGACNKRTLDIVDTKINDLSYYTKDHAYKTIFGEDFYDLLETSRFNLIQGVSGVVINGVKPNFVLETHRFITDYDPKYGLNLSTRTHIRTTKLFNQNSSFTFFMSFIHNNTKTCEISFSNTLNSHNKFYPHYRITSNKLIIDYQSGTHETQFTSDFQNKQLFVWICFDGTQNLYKMAMSNYSSYISETFNPPVNFQSSQLEIDYEACVNKIGFTDHFIDVNSLVHHRIMLEEKRNGSYLE